MAGLNLNFLRRLGWTLLAFSVAAVATAWFFYLHPQLHFPGTGENMKRLILLPTSLALAVFFLLSACASKPSATVIKTATAPAVPVKPYMAQVVGVQWLNPLQRRDYSTEWQLLWTLGLAKPNKFLINSIRRRIGFSIIK